MSSKRKAVVAAVPSPEPKRRQSGPQAAAASRGRKRTVEEDEEEEEEKPVKRSASVASKRSSTPSKSRPSTGDAGRRTSSSSSAAASSAIKGRGGSSRQSKAQAVADDDDDEEEEEEEEEEPPKSVKKPAARLSTGKKADDKPASVKPRASMGGEGGHHISRAEVAAATRHMNAALPSSEDEIVTLWQQYWTSLDTCMSTVTPMFLVLVLALYAFSAITKSQTIASIGLVYVFVFLIIMGSYFFAIVPFILVSNALSSLIAPGKTAQRDVVRLVLLLVCVVGLLAYSKYGMPKL